MNLGELLAILGISPLFSLHPAQLGYVCNTSLNKVLKDTNKIIKNPCLSLFGTSWFSASDWRTSFSCHSQSWTSSPFFTGVVLQLFGADFHSQLLSLYKQQMFCFYELVSKHTGMAAFTGFSLTSAITVKRNQTLRICSDWKQNVFLAAWPEYLCAFIAAYVRLAS